MSLGNTGLNTIPVGFFAAVLWGGSLICSSEGESQSWDYYGQFLKHVCLWTSFYGSTVGYRSVWHPAFRPDVRQQTQWGPSLHFWIHLLTCCVTLRQLLSSLSLSFLIPKKKTMISFPHGFLVRTKQNEVFLFIFHFLSLFSSPPSFRRMFLFMVIKIYLW